MKLIALWAIALVACQQAEPPTPTPDPCAIACANVGAKHCNRLGSEDTCLAICHAAGKAYPVSCVAKDAPCDVLERCR